MIKRKYFFSVFANNLWRKMLYLLYHNHFKPVSYTHLDVYKRQLFHDLFDGSRTALYCARQRPAAQSTETHHLHFDLITIFFRQTVVIRHDDITIQIDHRTFLGIIQRNDRNILQTDILPDIQLRPVADREHTDTLTFVYTGVVDLSLIHI